MDLEYVFVDLADEYWRGAGKENRRIKKKKTNYLYLGKPKSPLHQRTLVVSSENS